MRRNPLLARSRIESADAADGLQLAVAHRVRLSLVSWEFLGLLICVAVGGSALLGDDSDELEGGTRSGILGRHEALLEALMLHPDGKTLISSGWDDTVRFWEVGSSEPQGRELARLIHDSHPLALAMSPDGKWLAVGGSTSFALWELGAEGWNRAIREEGSMFRGIAFSPDGRSLALTDEGGMVHIRQGPGWRESRSFAGHPDYARSIEFSPRGDMLAIQTFRGDFRLWDPATGAECPILAGKVGRIDQFNFSPDGRSIALAEPGEHSSTISIRDLKTGELKAQFTAPSEYIAAMACSPDGKSLATSGLERAIQLWDTSTGLRLGKPILDRKWVKRMVFTGDGAWLAYGGNDGSIKLLSMEGRGAVAEAGRRS